MNVDFWSWVGVWRVSMAKPLLRFVRVGGQVTLQDTGRRHAMHTGFTEGGAMDLHAYFWSNRLLERHSAAPVFEVTLGNTEIEFLQNCQIAITGADLDAKLNGESLSPWNNYVINRSDILTFGLPKTGLRSYLAVNADIEVERFFDSVSSVVREQMQGVAAQTEIKTGTEILTKEIAEVGLSHSVPKRFIPDYNALLKLELIAGYQFEQFPKEAIKTLLNSTYTISANSNRMAYSLEGPAINHDIQTLASEGIACGAIQIPPDGQPVILLNDRQSMGGYPKVGCITKITAGSLAQRISTAEVVFVLSEMMNSHANFIRLQHFFRNSLGLDRYS